MHSHIAVLAFAASVAAPPGPMLYWHRNNNDVPRYSVAANGQWPRASTAPRLPDRSNPVVLRACPSRNEFMAVSLDERGALQAQRWDGQAFGAATRLCASAGTGPRAFDAAYEQRGGRLVTVYWDAAAARLMFATHDGTRFSTPAAITLSSTSVVRVAALTAKRESTEVILLALLADGRLDAVTWNGASWSTAVNFATSAASTDAECFAAAYAAASGNAVAAYGVAGQTTVRYRTLSGGRWSMEQAGPAVGAAPVRLRLAAHPTSNSALLAAFDGVSNIRVAGFNGATFSAAQAVETSAATTTRRLFDLAYEPGGQRALLAYAERGLSAVRYRTWNGAAWSGELSGPRLSNEPWWITVASGNESAEAYVVTADGRDSLSVCRWDGSVLGAATELEGRLADAAAQETFCLAVPGLSPVKVLRWRELPH